MKSNQVTARAPRYGWLILILFWITLILTVWVAPTINDRAIAQTSTELREERQIERFMFTDLAERVIPSVVTVYVKRSLTEAQQKQMDELREFFDQSPFRDFFDVPEMPGPGQEGDSPLNQSSGSGVVISADGYIITNWHVVGGTEDESDIRVVFNDDSEVSGEDVELVYSHPLTDLAVLKVKKSGLTPARWGDSSKLRVGERVAAIGSPLDLRATITQGIVSAMHREVGGAGFGDMIQTDAVINPGSSGGALVNMAGELVGINRLITTNTGRWQGYGFAIPANDARRFADEVISKGKVTYGYIGIMMADEMQNSAEMREALGLQTDAEGVLITQITPGGPAEAAGLQAGDFITEVNGQPVEDNADLLWAVARSTVGDKITMTIQRADRRGNARERKIDLTVAERPGEQELSRQQFGRRMRPEQPQQDAPDNRELGLSVEPYSQDGTTGLRVTTVAPDSAAAKAGLQVGDVLLSLNRKDLARPGDLEQAIGERISGRAHVLQFMRNGRTALITIDAGEDASEN